MSAEVIESIKAAFNDKYLGSISKSKAAQDSSREGIALCNYKISSTNKYKNMLADEYRVIADNRVCHGDTLRRFQYDRYKTLRKSSKS